jgi:hypothetical protein
MRRQKRPRNERCASACVVQGSTSLCILDNGEGTAFRTGHCFHFACQDHHFLNAGDVKPSLARNSPVRIAFEAEVYC